MRLILIILIGIAFVGCDNSESSSDVTKDNSQDELSKYVHNSLSMRHAYITDIVEAGDEGKVKYIKVDFVNYYTGSEAMEAEWKDKAYMILDSDTISGITDDYYISNMNDKLRTFKVSDDVLIAFNSAYLKRAPNSEGKFTDFVYLNEFVDKHSLVMFFFNEDVVESVQEVFLPELQSNE
tara:strand:- start:2032 stop:2571 length:540 start_codon:yes stop_codon:yes gene_type:complete